MKPPPNPQDTRVYEGLEAIEARRGKEYADLCRAAGYLLTCARTVLFPAMEIADQAINGSVDVALNARIRNLFADSIGKLMEVCKIEIEDMEALAQMSKNDLKAYLEEQQ